MRPDGSERVDVLLATRALSRRHFFGAVATGVVSAAAARRVAGQAAQLPEGGVNPQEAQMEGAGMEGDAYRPVQLPPKAGSTTRLTDLQRDAVERQIACPCPCTLDVFTCRTSMPSCGFSPRMHRDVIALIEGGYSGDEILGAFEGAYGEEARMAPRREGFNWVGYLLPSAAILTGGAAIAAFIRNIGRNAPAQTPVTPLGVDASADELARLDAAVRREVQ